MTFQNEMAHVVGLSDLGLAEYMQNSLISRATGGEFDENLYKYIRSELIKNKSIESYLPRWIKTCRDPNHFWGFIKPKFTHYEERRVFIRDEFSELLNFLEFKTVTPIDKVIKFGEEHIYAQWEKALDRKNSDPEGAITTARTLIESILKYILDEQKILYSDNSDLSKLYKDAAKSLNLAPEQHQEQIFKQILGGANGIINGLGSLRNKLGDAHGKGKANIKPEERHSELAVNLAGSMALFLYKTYRKKCDEV